jgi:ketosteroid isomerase-like protein
MKTQFKWLVITGIASLVTLSSCKQETQQEPQKPTVEELGQMNRDFAQALVDGDAEAAANQYDENASLLPPNEPIVTGRENIRAYWQGAIDAGVVGAKVKTISADSDGDLAYEIGTFELQIKLENDSIIVDTGKYTEILKRNAEGKWISLYGMWSNNE